MFGTNIQFLLPTTAASGLTWLPKAPPLPRHEAVLLVRSYITQQTE